MTPTKRSTRSSIWIIAGAILLVLAGLLVVLALVNPESATPAAPGDSTPAPTATEVPPTTAPDTPTPEPTPSDVELAASVNGYTITQDYLSRTVRLNRVLGKLSGASTLGKRETLQRLIRSQLILQGVESVEEPSQEDVQGFISSLERNWRVSPDDLDQELDAVSLERAFLVDTIDRLLTVQAAVDQLEADGENISEWLRAQEQQAEIMVYEELAEEPESSPTADAESPTATPEPQAEAPEVAPNFTLQKAGGGSLTLQDQLEEGPVVLVFFERCG
jgi:hypothetical protein